METLYFGALSGTALWLMVYPLDVIKSVMQTDNLQKPKFGNSISSVAKTLYANGGNRRFFQRVWSYHAKSCSRQWCHFCYF